MYSAIIAQNPPMQIPPKISVGKCTAKYILDHTMQRAMLRHGIPNNNGRWKNSNKPADTELVVCPDGNDQSFCGGNNASKPTMISYGRLRFTVFLMNKLVTNAPSSCAVITVAANVRWERIANNRHAIDNQRIPPFPSCVIRRTHFVSRSFRSRSCIHNKNCASHSI